MIFGRATNERRLSGLDANGWARGLKRFNTSAQIILVLTGLAKLWSAFGHARLLEVTDPIFDIQFRHLMIAVGTAELLIAMACNFNGSSMLAAALVAFLATNLAAYRIGLILIGYRKPCECLGNLADSLHVRPQTADSIMKVILAYLLVGSYAALFWHWRQKRKASGTAR